ncbi:DoxX family protein [Sphaerisporangium album]|uniref:DoxX family protein n=1 Tax=Sphaerisporangium album TaxID=509200 RepID=UPI0015F0D1D5|nr:DoxX family protein [Sphaerisporangium album]
MRRALQDLASLAARLGVGGIFFANGWHKLEFGLTATSDQFAKMGAPGPGVWAASTMLIELLGGALLVAGLAVPACGLVLFAEALAVFVLVSGDTGLPLTGGDINLIVALGAASVLLAVVGAGRLSIDHLVVIRRREAEAADEMAADAEADDVISSWREPDRPATTGTGARTEDAASPGTGTKAPGAGPVTFPKVKDKVGDTTAAGDTTGAGGTGGTTGGTARPVDSAPPATPADSAEVTAPRKPPRTRRPSKPADTPRDAVPEPPADAPSTPTTRGDRLVAGGRKPGPSDTE